MDGSMILTIAGIAVLLAMSALFSGSETALTAVSRPRMHQLARHGDRRAAIVNALRDRPERLIGAILLGNNLVNILSSALATGMLIALFGATGIVYATVIVTLLVLIFGEVAPKTYAIAYADRTALALAPALKLVVTVLSPATETVQWIVRGLFRLLGVRTRPEDEEAREQALRGAIELHRGRAAEVRHERAMLRSILDLADVEVGKIMQHRKDVEMVDADLPAGKIVDAVLESGYTRIPLYRGDPDNIVGVLHAKALLSAVRKHLDDLDKIDIAEIGTRPWFIPESTSLLDQLQEFRRRREHFALVVDEYGSLMGVVTLEDILEEIVGDIADEHDEVLVGVRPQPDGSFVVNGSVTIRDLNRRFEWNLPDDQAATVAGLVIHESRVIPEVGQIFMFHGFRFEVLKRQRNQITSLRITPPRRPPDEVAAATAR
ncbi:MAG TPA: HlyC/CorC family transporter [Alphaproteobacteria bacterium]